ncbi:MAG: hypothetical protein OES47_00900 [Acidobacteriota bacterium]|nr:hypothetical protein [Acidobacteriota bacterium]
MRTGSVTIGATVLAVALGAAPAEAWSPRTQLAILDQAASIAPPDLRRQLVRHKKQMRRGLLTPFEPSEATKHVTNEDGSGILAPTLETEVERAVTAIRSHQPFQEIVFQIGVVAHFVADANNPLTTANSDPAEARYFADYLRYVEASYPKFPVVFYGDGRDLGVPDDLRAMIGRSLERGRGLYPLVGREYERIGRIDGISAFDDRSTAFGVGSLAFSHAVSDVAAVLRYIWIRAGGADERDLPLGPSKAAGR